MGPYDFDERGFMIPLQGEDIAPLPVGLQAPERMPEPPPPQFDLPGVQPPAAMPNGVPNEHTLSILQGGQQRDFHYRNGQIDPREYQEDVARTQQALGMAQADFLGGGIPPASGPHSDKFDYEYSPQQIQRMTTLQQARSKVMYDPNLRPAQKLHATTMMDRELDHIMKTPMAKPKQKPPTMPNGQVVGVPFTDKDTGIRLVTKANGDVMPLRDPAEHIPSISEISKLRNDVYTSLIKDMPDGKGGTKKVFPTKEEVDAGVEESLAAHEKFVTRFRQSRHPANPSQPSEPQPGATTPDSPELQEFNQIRADYPLLSKADLPTQKRYFELKKKLGR